VTWTAPAGELARIEDAGPTGQAAVAGQKAGEREPPGTGERRRDGDQSGGRGGGGHHAPPRTAGPNARTRQEYCIPHLHVRLADETPRVMPDTMRRRAPAPDTQLCAEWKLPPSLACDIHRRLRARQRQPTALTESNHRFGAWAIRLGTCQADRLTSDATVAEHPFGVGPFRSMGMRVSDLGPGTAG